MDKQIEGILSLIFTEEDMQTYHKVNKAFQELEDMPVGAWPPLKRLLDLAKGVEEKGEVKVDRGSSAWFNWVGLSGCDTPHHLRGAYVEAELRDGNVVEDSAENLNWQHDGLNLAPEFEIVAYRVLTRDEG